MKQVTLDSLKRYVQHHCPTGSFLNAVLENNLMESLGRADEENQRDILEIVRYLHWEMPSACHGSPEKVAAWLEVGRLQREEEYRRQQESANENALGSI